MYFENRKNYINIGISNLEIILLKFHDDYNKRKYKILFTCFLRTGFTRFRMMLFYNVIILILQIIMIFKFQFQINLFEVVSNNSLLN